MTTHDNKWFSHPSPPGRRSPSAIVVVLLDGLDVSFSVDPMISVMATAARGRRRPAMLGHDHIRAERSSRKHLPGWSGLTLGRQALDPPVRL